MTKLKSSVAVIGITAFALSACVPNQVPDFGNSPTYPSGYRDGCASATEAEKKFASKVIRDETLFQADAGYRQGWRQGFIACSGDRTFQEEQDPFSPSS